MPRFLSRLSPGRLGLMSRIILLCLATLLLAFVVFSVWSGIMLRE